MKYSLRSLMIAMLVIPPLLALALYIGGLATLVGVIVALVCAGIALVGRALAV